MLPCPTGLQKRRLASSEALCRSATCRHNRVTSREFQGTYFLFARVCREIHATGRSPPEQSAVPNGPAGVGRSVMAALWPSQAFWPSDELWPNLLSRSADRSVLGGRGHVRQRGRTVDGFDDLIGREVMDHVAETGKNGQLALGNLLMQPP